MFLLEAHEGVVNLAGHGVGSSPGFQNFGGLLAKFLDNIRRKLRHLDPVVIDKVFQRTAVQRLGRGVGDDVGRSRDVADDALDILGQGVERFLGAVRVPGPSRPSGLCEMGQGVGGWRKDEIAGC